MKKTNKLILIIAIAVAVLTIALLIFWQRSVPNQTLDINLVTSDRVFFPKIVSKDNQVFYLSNKGIIWYKYNLSTKEKKQVINNEILGATNIVYSPTGEEAIVFSDYPLINAQYYNLNSTKNLNMATGITNLVFSQDGQTIYYRYQNIEGISTLNKSLPDGSNWQKIIDLESTNAPYYLHSTKSSLFFTNLSDLYQLDLKANSKTKIITGNLSEDVLVSDDEQKIIYNMQNQDPTSVYSLDNKQIVNLKEKINLKGSALGANNQLYYIENLNTLKIIDLANESVKIIKLNSSAVDKNNLIDDSISNLTLNGNNKILYFTYNNYLYKISL